MTDQDFEVSLNAKTLVGLSKVDEERMIKEIKRFALKQCDALVKEYIDCAQNNMFWLNCKPLARKMNQCVKQYTTEVYRDQVRLKYLRDKQEKIESV